MPIQTLNTIKSWFKTTLKPTQDQFWDTWDSFRHKLEKVPLKDVEDLEVILNKKAEKAQLDAHQTNLNAHSDLFAKKEDNANKGVANGYAPLDEVAKIASQYLNIINDLVAGGSNSLLSAEQGKILQNQINGIHTLLQSDNANLDTLQQIVDAIEEFQMSLSTILVNDLTTGGTTKALSAEMGKYLNLIKANLESPVFTGIPTAPTAAKNTNSTQIATTEFVKSALNDIPTGGSGNYVVTDNDTGTAQKIKGDVRIGGKLEISNENDDDGFNQDIILIRGGANSGKSIRMFNYIGNEILYILGDGSISAKSFSSQSRIYTPQITIVDNPLEPTDGVNKAYVDSLVSGGGGIPITLQSVTDVGAGTSNSIDVNGVGIGEDNFSFSLYNSGWDKVLKARGFDPLRIDADNGIILRSNQPLTVIGDLNLVGSGYSSFHKTDSETGEQVFQNVKGADGTEPDDFVTKRQLDANSGTSNASVVVYNNVIDNGGFNSDFFNYEVGNEDENLIIMFQCEWNSASPSSTGLEFSGTYWNGGSAYQFFEGDMGILNIPSQTISGRFKKGTTISLLRSVPYGAVNLRGFSCSILKLPNI